jgi:glucose-1-phosphate adenylyltransferase
MASSRILGMILAGGRVGELSVLTLRRPKSAMPFGGMYRVIDCALTNLTESGIENIGILSQYRPLSLMDHVGWGEPWDLTGIRRGVRFLPPHTGVKDSDWYKGTADALFQNVNYIRDHNPDRVLIVSGDHIYRMNYDPIINLHKRHGAEVTIAVTPVEVSQASRFGLVRTDSEGRVIEYAEKPQKPISNLASMTVYLFETEVLIRELEQNAQTGKTYHLYDEVLPEVAARGELFAYVFNNYWSYSRTLNGYFNTCMDCTGSKPLINLTRWRLRTRIEGNRVGDPPPVLTGTGAQILDSVVSPGCEIFGRVQKSVLSPRVIIEEGAEVSDCVIFDGVRVRSGAKLHKVILDKCVMIGADCRIGEPAAESARPNTSMGSLLSEGLTVIGKNSRIPDSMRIGKNVLIYPDSMPDDFSSNILEDGSTVSKGSEGV